MDKEKLEEYRAKLEELLPSMEISFKDADKIAVISEGHCVEYGTFDELMELKGEFYRMKKIQS